MRIKLNTINGKTEYVETSDVIKFNKYKTVKKRCFNRIKEENETIEYYNIINCLDTETSHVGELGWIYQYAFNIDNDYYIGRTPLELMEQLKTIKELFQLNNNKRMVFYVHNLSYDFTYLIRYLTETFGEFEILAIKERKVLSVTGYGFEFRCSYLLSNMSLARWGEFTKADVVKAVGAIDYNIVRYQDTRLTKNDWFYMINDIVAQKKCIEIEMLAHNDNIVTIPLTSTGYVRRDIRNACRDKSYRDFFQKTALNANTYKSCKMAFMGGLCLTNRYFVNETVNGIIGHFDFKSHYPARQLLDYFPVSKFVLYCATDKYITLDEYNKIKDKYCILAKVFIKNPKLKKNVTSPYISESKIINTNYESYVDEKLTIHGNYNGRLINAKGWITLQATELDIKWYINQYQFDKILFTDVYISNRGEQPDEIKKVIYDYFVKKETLEKDSYFYMKSKNKLNACYGMEATDIVRDEIIYSVENGDYSKEKIQDIETIQEKLDIYYSSRNNFMPFQFGVWTTAHARDKLLTIISEVIGYERFLYCDTDSEFFIAKDEKEYLEIVERINKYNESVIKLCKEKNAYCKNRDGKISYIGTFEDEKEGIKSFRTLHSKCYAFINKKNELKATIAGVKSKGVDGITREEELGDINNLNNGFIFYKCGGTISKYITHDIECVKINGHDTWLADACIIEQTTKEINELNILLEEWDVC